LSLDELKKRAIICTCGRTSDSLSASKNKASFMRVRMYTDILSTLDMLYFDALDLYRVNVIRLRIHTWRSM
jgi:hypothetical protein